MNGGSGMEKLYTEVNGREKENEVFLRNAKELYNLSILAEVNRMNNVMPKEFSYRTTFFQQVQKHLK